MVQDQLMPTGRISINTKVRVLWVTGEQPLKFNVVIIRAAQPVRRPRIGQQGQPLIVRL